MKNTCCSAPVKGKSFFDYSDEEKQKIVERAVITGSAMQKRTMLLGTLKTYWKHLQDENDERMMCPYEWDKVFIAIGWTSFWFGIGVLVGGRI